jgi:xanthine/uracil permease
MIVLVEKLKVERLFVAVAIVGQIVMVPVIVGEMTGLVGEMTGLVVEIDLLVEIPARIH